MRNRFFSTVLFLLACLAPALVHAQAGRSQSGVERIETDLSVGWRFKFGETDQAVVSTGFDDRTWESIDVPHTWNRIGAYQVERTADSDNRQGVGWYRLTFAAPATTGSRRQVLDFAGVGAIAEVWVNGVRVGEHRGAYTRFRFDVTDQWRAGQDNLIVVRADNSKPALGSSTAEVLPLSGDFFVFGGLYRGVKLITTAETSFDLLDYGGPGVYVRTSAIDDNVATIDVLSRLRNNAGASVRLTAVATIIDREGREVARGRTPVTLSAGGTSEARHVLRVRNPRLWNGRRDPYQYEVRVALEAGGHTLDTVTQPLGIRTFSVDADRGFFLNGEHLPLHGVSRHQDREGRGYALTPEDHAEDMRLIAELGANTVRGAHYPHADDWYDLADDYGMIMWAEVPYISASSFDGSDGTPATFANAEQQTIELIRQQYNHPSVVMWGTGNEVDASMLFLGIDKPAQGLALLQAITDVARREDPHRPTVFADCCEDTAFSRPGQQVLTGVTDLMGYNRYYGWYYGQPGDLGPEMDRLRAKHPGVPLSVSEFGAGGAVTQHTDNPLGGSINAFGRPHPEEYQNWFHEVSWQALKSRDYIFASWIWNMFDFASDLREEGDAIDLNNKGLITYDRKTRKDAFYFYQANWSDAPVLYLTGRRYVDRAYPVIDVRAYSNADTVSLTLNGQALGDAACPDRICVWKDVRLAAGANDLVVAATINGEPIEDRIRLNGPDSRDGLRIRSGTLTGHAAPDGPQFGSDNFFEGGQPNILNLVIPGMSFPRKDVTGTTDAWMYETYRSGDFRYDLPLADGDWILVVHTFEPDADQAATRTFAVKVDGRLALDGFNPAQAGGGALTAVERHIQVTARGGRVSVEFLAQGGPAVLAALEVRPATR